MFEEVFSSLVSKIPVLGYLENKYVVSLLILIAAASFAKLILYIFANYLEKFAAKTKTDLDDLILDRVKKPFFYLVFLLFLKILHIILHTL